jgi:hypothetical protein
MEVFMAKKTPPKKPQVSEEISKLKSELSDKALDKVAGGALPYPLRRGVNS